MTTNNTTAKQHTAGPWTARPCTGSASGLTDIVDSRDAVIVSHMKVSANARLIAAAPELLAILKQLTATYAREYQTLTDGQFGEAPGVAEARIAIAKAEGTD